MMTLVTSSRRPAVIAWNSALCSRIDRQHGRAGLLGAAHEQRAGADEAFLVGERERRAAFDRRERRLKPRRAGDRADHPFGRTARRLGDRVGPGRGLDAGPRQFRLQFADRRRDPRPPRSARRVRAPAWRAPTPFLCAVSASTVNLPGLALEQIDRARPDRAGRAENRHRAHGGGRLRSWREFHSASNHQTSRPRAGPSRPPRSNPTMTAAAAAVKNPSSRSISPPWPGMSWLASLASKRRLIAEFEQIAGLRNDRQAERHKDQHWGDSKPGELHDQQTRRDAAEQCRRWRRTRSSSG